jgi:hypothetical protein
MNEVKISGTEFIVNAKNENLYELILKIQNQTIHTYKFDLNNYQKMINNLKQTNFSQNIDYSLDFEKTSGFYITRWETNGVPTYCSRAWINNEWSQYSIIKEQDLKMMPTNLEKLIIKKMPEKVNLNPNLPKAIISQKINNSENNDLDILKKEMLGFLNVKKEELKKG